MRRATVIHKPPVLFSSQADCPFVMGRIPLPPPHVSCSAATTPWTLPALPPHPAPTPAIPAIAVWFKVWPLYSLMGSIPDSGQTTPSLHSSLQTSAKLAKMTATIKRGPPISKKTGLFRQWRDALCRVRTSFAEVFLH